MNDLVIRGGTIVDGSGQTGRTGDIAIKDGKIVQQMEGVTDAATLEKLLKPLVG